MKDYPWTKEELQELIYAETSELRDKITVLENRVAVLADLGISRTEVDELITKALSGHVLRKHGGI